MRRKCSRASEARGAKSFFRILVERKLGQELSVQFSWEKIARDRRN